MSHLESDPVLGERHRKLGVTGPRFCVCVGHGASREKDTLGDACNDPIENRVSIADQHLAEVITIRFYSAVVIMRRSRTDYRHIGPRVESLDDRQAMPILQHLLERDVAE